ncbi:hypothetical protein [Treponema phagedenis]|uniref:hypothetical protein n=1 Tax=Treponema phagedenis TaxID=162 RepID=UPI00209100B0|nr:hypothetical protein [Treponema phagedenis]
MKLFMSIDQITRGHVIANCLQRRPRKKLSSDYLRCEAIPHCQKAIFCIFMK